MNYTKNLKHQALTLHCMQDLPKSAILVLDMIQTQGPLSPKQLIEKINVAPRTISFALKLLMKRGKLSKKPNLADMRQPFYMIPGTEQSWKIPPRDASEASKGRDPFDFDLKEVLAHLIEYEDLVENYT